MVAKGLPPRRTLLQRTSLVRQRLGLLLVSGRGYVRVGCVLLAQWTPASCVVPRFRCLDGRHAFLARVQRSLHRRLLDVPGGHSPPPFPQYLSGVMLAFVWRHRLASGGAPPASTWLASATGAAFVGLFFIDTDAVFCGRWCMEHLRKRFGRAHSAVLLACARFTGGFGPSVPGIHHAPAALVGRVGLRHLRLSRSHGQVA
mmetsp:Transcript_146457/g.467861  ORF Transcript_146457/g.467861 Transcript_146457/m.467861 type:complete len:201 (+) Transcript_146457:444-1046(+)